MEEVTLETTFETEGEQDTRCRGEDSRVEGRGSQGACEQVAQTVWCGRSTHSRGEWALRNQGEMKGINPEL